MSGVALPRRQLARLVPILGIPLVVLGVVFTVHMLSSGQALDRPVEPHGPHLPDLDRNQIRPRFMRAISEDRDDDPAPEAAAAARPAPVNTPCPPLPSAEREVVQTGPVAVGGKIPFAGFRYWQETVSKLPKESLPPTDRYVSFEPWQGGFNNIRMSLEIAAAFAFVTKRTLVMPPSYNMYLRGESHLNDYMDEKDLSRGVPVVSFEEFKERTKFHELPNTRKVDYTVDLRGPFITWDSSKKHCESKNMRLCTVDEVCEDKVPFWEAMYHGEWWAPVADSENEWLYVGDAGVFHGKTCKTHSELHLEKPSWGQQDKPLKQGKGITPCCSKSGKQRRRLLQGGSSLQFNNLFRGVMNMPKAYIVTDRPNGGFLNTIYCVPDCPLDNSPMRDSLKRYNQDNAPVMSINDPKIRDASVVHFRQNLLGQFYRNFWFQDPAQDMALKRFMKNHMHYTEKCMGPAERIIRELGDFNFSCIHIRRGDFQHPQQRNLPAERILDNTRAFFLPNEKVYIATDERDKKFFKPITDALNTRFFDDFAQHVKDSPGFLIPSIESIVCTRARIFVGTQLSTFTGYIQRMRGYMPDVQHKEIFDTYRKYPVEYAPGWSEFHSQPTCQWCREFAEAWDGL